MLPAPDRMDAPVHTWADTGSIQGFHRPRECFAWTRKPSRFNGKPGTLATRIYPRAEHGRSHPPRRKTCHGSTLCGLRFDQIHG